MPVIRITDATWDRLKDWAIPLEDSPEDAIRKVLDAVEYVKNDPTKLLKLRAKELKNKKTKHYPKLSRGEKTPQSAYRRPILETIYELGSSASATEVLAIVKQKMKHLLKDIDYQELASGGDIRWRNTAQWERLVLVQDGLLKSDSPSGVWELTGKGIREARGGQ